jgi:hypothetical protein
LFRAVSILGAALFFKFLTNTTATFIMLQGDWLSRHQLDPKNKAKKGTKFCSRVVAVVPVPGGVLKKMSLQCYSTLTKERENGVG